MEIQKFRNIPYHLNIFQNLPDELHHEIYSYIIYDVYNSLWYDINWYDIIRNIGENDGYEYIMDRYNDMIKNNMIKNDIINNDDNLLIDDCDKHDVGMYLEKVKPSIWGKRYVYFEDDINEDKATKLIIDSVDKYINSDKYNNKDLFDFNFHLLFLNGKSPDYCPSDIKENLFSFKYTIFLDVKEYIEKSLFKKKIGILHEKVKNIKNYK
tara:strand:+ start:2073 stop:2702 length:630 start_codon:yes stop_codon:yes gene_type:complete